MTPRMAVAADLAELVGYYTDPPSGVRANMIFSADGAAAFAGRAGPLSNPTDHGLLLALRLLADVVLVGAGTARAEGYGPVRLGAAGIERTHAPPIAVVSGSGRLPESLFADPAQRPILVTTARSANDPRFPPDDRPEVLIAGEDHVDVVDLVAQLRDRGMHRILCEGGPTLLDDLVAADLVDELCVTLAPKLAGTQPVGDGDRLLTAPRALRLRHVVSHDDFLYVKYCRRDPR